MGLISKLFAKGVASRLQKDKDLQKAINKTDREMEKIRKDIESTADKETIKKAAPPEVRKALGFDY